MFKDRLTQLRGNSITQAEAAKAVGVGRSTYSYWEQGHRVPDMHDLSRICMYFSCSAQWLIFGTDEAATNSRYPQIVWVPRYNIALGAGPGFALDTEAIQDYVPLEATYVRERGLDPRKLSFCRADGDSMEPRIHDGDEVLIDHRPVAKFVDDVYALRYGNNEGVIKSLQFLPGNLVRVISENPKYPPFDLDLSDPSNGFEIIGRARRHSGDL